MNARRFFWAAFAAVLLTRAPLYAFDWGVTLDNASAALVGEEVDWEQEDKLALWLGSELGKSCSFFLQGSYTFTDDRPYLFDLDTLTLGGKFPEVGGLALFSFTLGRFPMADFTGTVLNHSADGFSLEFVYPASSIGFALGYTGLHLKPVSSIEMSLADAANAADNEVLLAPPRVLGALKVAFPEAFARQDLTFSLVFQQDLRDGDDLLEEGETAYNPSLGGLLNTLYPGVGLTGPITSWLYYDLFGYFGTGRMLSFIDGEYRYKPILSALGGVNLRLYLEQFLSSRLSLGALYASGDADAGSTIEGNTAGQATVFIPISASPSALIFKPALSNLFLVQLDYSLKPLAWTRSSFADNFQAALKVVPFFRSTPGPVSEGGLNPASDALYLGTEVDGTLSLRLFSDFGLGLSVGIFVPNSGDDGSFLESARTTEFIGKLDVSFSF
jgi:hypothetical protein